MQGATKGCVLDRPLFAVHYGKKLTFNETVSLDLHWAKNNSVQFDRCANFEVVRIFQRMVDSQGDSPLIQYTTKRLSR